MKKYSFFQYPRGVNKGGVLDVNEDPTVTTSSYQHNVFLVEMKKEDTKNQYTLVQDEEGKLYRVRIRKLTPKECFRLMDVSDEDAEKMLAVNSKSQCYKQAGNSIVVACLVDIFRNMFINPSERLKHKDYRQVSIFDIKGM